MFMLRVSHLLTLYLRVMRFEEIDFSAYVMKIAFKEEETGCDKHVQYGKLEEVSTVKAAQQILDLSSSDRSEINTAGYKSLH